MEREDYGKVLETGDWSDFGSGYDHFSCCLMALWWSNGFVCTPEKVTIRDAVMGPCT